MTDYIGLTDDQREILTEAMVRARRAETRLREMIRLLGGPGAVYEPEKGRIRVASEQKRDDQQDPEGALDRA